MRINRLFFLALATSVACTSARQPVSATPSSVHQMRVVGYLASWGVRSKGTKIAELPGKDLTHIFYAFGRIGDDGRVGLGDPCADIGACETENPTNPGGNFAELRRLKQLNPHLRLVVSIGGWTGSGKFSDAALTDSSRRLFTESAIDVFIRQTQGLFDGIDLDWEFPVSGGLETNVRRPADKENFTLLLAELRRQLDAEGARDSRHYELAIAVSANPRAIANLEIERIVPLLDFINVMTYDYHAGSSRTGFNSPLYAAVGDPTASFNADVSIRAFREAGVPAAKLLVGIPFYGRAYGSVPNINGGLFQPGGRPEGWRGGDGDWRTLSRTRLKDPRYVRHWESSARVPWLFDSTSGTWVSYDDPESVGEKVRYAREHGLGGVFIWELGGDDGSLMQAISKNR